MWDRHVYKTFWYITVANSDIYIILIIFTDLMFVHKCKQISVLLTCISFKCIVYTHSNNNNEKFCFF